MGEMSEEVKKALKEFGSDIVATADKAGRPNVSTMILFMFRMMSMWSLLALVRPHHV